MAPRVRWAVLAALLLAAGDHSDATTVSSERRLVHEVALSPTASGLWTVAVTLGPARRPHRFVVDTGSERTVLAAHVAALLELPVRQGPILLTPAGRVSAQEATVDRLDIGGLAVTSLATVVVDLQALGRGWPMDGILGMDVLGRGDVLIDFTRARLTMGDDLRAPGGVVLATRSVAGRRVVAARVDGRVRELVLDTGAAAFVVFDGGGHGERVQVGAAGVAVEARRRRAEVAVGGVQFGGVPVVRLPPVASRIGSDGLLPGTLFSRIFIGADRDEVRVVPRR